MVPVFAIGLCNDLVLVVCEHCKEYMPQILWRTAVPARIHGYFYFRYGSGLAFPTLCIYDHLHFAPHATSFR